MKGYSLRPNYGLDIDHVLGPYIPCPGGYKLHTSQVAQLWSDSDLVVGGKPKHDVIILDLMAHGKSRSSGAGCLYFWRFTCSLVSPPPCPPTTQLIQAQEGVEVGAPGKGGCLSPSSIPLLHLASQQFKLQTYISWRAGLHILFFRLVPLDTDWILWCGSQKLLEHSFYLFIFIQLSGHHCLGTTVPKQKLSFRQRRTREQFWPVVPTHHSFATSPAWISRKKLLLFCLFG